jgi:hypothetical protein
VVVVIDQLVVVVVVYQLVVVVVNRAGFVALNSLHHLRTFHHHSHRFQLLSYG